MFAASLEKSGPKHSTSVPFSSEVAVPLSVDENKVALVPNPVPDTAVNGLPDPQARGPLTVLCGRIHSSLPFTLHMVIPFILPMVHSKMNEPLGQVGGAGMNCPETSPGG